MDSIYKAKKEAIVGTSFPQFTANSEEGPVTAELLKGKVVFIDFWFEGCHPRMDQMNAFNELYEKLKDNKDFLFVSFTRDSKETIQRVKKRFGLNFKVWSANTKECARLNFQSGYPTSMILDKTGTIKYIHGSGYDAIGQSQVNDFILTIMLSEIQSLL